MIKQFDHVAEFVKQRHKVSAEKMGGSLDMRTVLAKQKALGRERKQAKLRVILSRKLKLKLQMMLNVSTKHHRQLEKSALVDRSHASSTDRQPTRGQHVRQQSSSLRFSLKQSFSSRILPRSSSLKPNKSSLSSSQLGGQINLFEKLTEAELQAIQSDQGYYLHKPEHLQLFQRFMYKKRLNSKDSSYEKFTLKNSRRYLQLGYEPIENPKQFIIDTLRIDRRVGPPPQLLTNPHYESAGSLRKPSLQLFQKKGARMFEEFKLKQESNREKLAKERENKKLGLRIEINYKQGLAAEKKAMFSDRQREEILRRNSREDVKSKQRRFRIKTLLSQHGSSVEMAEKIRQEMLKRRSQRVDKRAVKF